MHSVRVLLRKEGIKRELEHDFPPPRPKEIVYQGVRRSEERIQECQGMNKRKEQITRLLLGPGGNEKG